MVAGKSYIDTNVERGKTYYYKISGIDEAGNEGDLSIEVYATALLDSTSVIPSGLDLRFYGIIDSLKNEIDMTIEESNSIKEKFKQRPEIERTIYVDFKLERDIDSAINELDALIKEIDNYKTQNLDKNEIDKKLNNAKLKFNTIKKKIPENLFLIDEKAIEKTFNDEDLTKLILSLDPLVEISFLTKKIKKINEIAKNDEFKVKIEGKNLEISYLDGTRKKYALIKEKISGKLENNENNSIIEIIPSSIEEKISNIDIKNVNYEILNEEGIVSFDHNTKEISYSFEKNIDLNNLEDIKTLPYIDLQDQKSNSALTGYLSFVTTKDNSFFGIVIGLIFASFLLIYLFLDRKKRKIEENLFLMRKKIHNTREKIIEGMKNDAIKSYSLISQEYKSLGNREKRAIYGEIEELYRKIKEN